MVCNRIKISVAGFFFFCFYHLRFFYFSFDIRYLKFDIWNYNGDLTMRLYTVLYFSIALLQIFFTLRSMLCNLERVVGAAVVCSCSSHLRRLVSFHVLNQRVVKLVLNWFWRYPQFWDQKNVLIPEFADKTCIWKPEPRNQFQLQKGHFMENV